MIVYFADRQMTILGMASTNLPQGFVIKDDVKTDDVDTGITTFEFDLVCGNNRTIAESLTAPGNFVLRSSSGSQEWYTIITTETDTDKDRVSVYAESAGLDLINEISDPYTATEAHPANFYVEKFTYDSGFEIGLNEISDRSRKLSWDDESTVIARLLSIATQFDAEISFSFVIDGLIVQHKYINLHEKRGNDLGMMLRLGTEIKRIIKSRSIEDVATALKVTGGIPEGAENPITLHGYTYDDGDFFVEGTYLKSREAWKKWSRYLHESGDYNGNIVGSFTYETIDQSELCNQAIAELRKRGNMTVNYEVELLAPLKSLNVGDIVRVVDNVGKMYLSARVLHIEESVANNTQTAILGDYAENTEGG